MSTTLPESLCMATGGLAIPSRGNRMSELIERAEKMQMDNKQVTPAGKRKPPAAGMGRKKGSQNKFTKDVKEMILTALGEAGGANYLLT